MTPSPDSFSLPDVLPDPALPFDSALDTPLDPALATSSDAPFHGEAGGERLNFAESVIASVSAFFSTLADRSHIVDSPSFFDTGRLSAQSSSFRRDTSRAGR
jgi:hypothetical protein